MFADIDVSPNSTVVNWEAIRAYGLINISPNPSTSQKTRFRFLAGCMIIMTLFYLVNLFKAMIDRKLWFFKTDRLGYGQPNIHTLLPLLSCITCMLVFSSIVLQERDYQNFFQVHTMLTQLVSYNFLHFAVVTRIWRIFASLPTNSVELSDAHFDYRPSISPQQFNTFICILYLSFPVVFLPLHIWMALNTFTVGRLWFQVMPVLDNLIFFTQGTMSELKIEELSQTAQEMLSKLHNPYIRGLLLWRLASSIYVLFITTELAMFTYASIRLLNALQNQLQVIRQAKIHATQLANINIHVQAEPVTSSEPTFNPRRKKSSTWFWMWLTSNGDIEPYVWNDINTVLFSEVRYLEENYGIINRYRNVILCQLILLGILKVSFWILAVLLAFHVFGTVYHMPSMDIVLLLYEWSNWTWGAPGILLALITTCSTFMPSLSGQLKKKAVTKNTLDDHNSSQERLITSLGNQLTAIRQSVHKGFQRFSNQLSSVGSCFRSGPNELEIGREGPIVIDFSNLRYEESLRTKELIGLESYRFDEKIHPDSQYATDIDVIRALRAQDGRGDLVVRDIGPKAKIQDVF